MYYIVRLSMFHDKGKESCGSQKDFFYVGLMFYVHVHIHVLDCLLSSYTAAFTN